MASKIEQEKQR